ncbi:MULTISPECIES: glyoxalase/bleomycin resistance/dioxygenase family protein [Citrobacter]|uniref:glyoxalase/bleomycin resistance/dioxygenase family protein n=1 Tax=Citrobacter TaxID=544 RepID=UPI0005A817B9|nr:MULTISPECIES: glyoxalase/bleomycin resistance/dioxygenase family protein [Citrobacter]KSY32035.1 glyoxalase [Citrobacter sp. 50677481]HCQ7755079.1 glyoxalase/bleomycin resistance/dioxygenase family protein [Citrobacter sedlakii]HCU0296225.1 glyoxalase/bleomycin resistance/dioxygenase family protein [Citrobacter sedlakii]
MTPTFNEIDVMFVAGFGPVTRDTDISKAFYKDTLRLPLKHLEGNKEYMLTDVDGLEGVKHFALWPLSQAALSCFGTEEWPDDIPVPQGWIEFEVKDIERATDILMKKGYQLLIAGRLEPWGQTVTRLLSPEGLLTGVTITPWLRPESL